MHCFLKTTNITYVKASKLCITVNHITWGSTKSEPHMPAHYSPIYIVISHYYYQILSVSVIFQQPHGHFRQFTLLKLLHHAANLIQSRWNSCLQISKFRFCPSHRPLFFHTPRSFQNSCLLLSLSLSSYSSSFIDQHQ